MKGAKEIYRISRELQKSSLDKKTCIEASWGDGDRYAIKLAKLKRAISIVDEGHADGIKHYDIKESKSDISIPAKVAEELRRQLNAARKEYDESFEELLPAEVMAEGYLDHIMTGKAVDFEKKSNEWIQYCLTVPKEKNDILRNSKIFGQPGTSVDGAINLRIVSDGADRRRLIGKLFFVVSNYAGLKFRWSGHNLAFLRNSDLANAFIKSTTDMLVGLARENHKETK